MRAGEGAAGGRPALCDGGRYWLVANRVGEAVMSGDGSSDRDGKGRDFMAWDVVEGKWKRYKGKAPGAVV